MRLSILFALLACTLALAATAGASYLEGAPGPEPDPVRPRTVPDNPLTRLVQRVSVRPWYSHRGLTVFRIELPGVGDDTLYLSLDEALEADALVIAEKDAGSVPTLLARNRGKRPVLMLAGEIVVGGKQNRTLREDLLLPPHSDTVELPVYCVEQGRWSGGSKAFGSKSSLAAYNVRAATVAKASQREVWASVEHYRRNLSVAAETTDLQSVQDDSEVQRKLAEYIPGEVLRKHQRAFGMVVARGERIIGADVFCSPAVFAKHRRRLLESYAMDCLIETGDRTGLDVRRPSPASAERFLRSVLCAEFSWRETPGDGRLLEAAARHACGTALVRDHAVLHAALMARSPKPGSLPTEHIRRSAQQRAQ